MNRPTPHHIQSFLDEGTSTFTHVLSDPSTSRCAIIDSVLNFDPKSGRTRTDSADQVAAHVREQGLTVDWHLETHVHADHLSAAPHLQQALGGRIGIGSAITEVRTAFAHVFPSSNEGGFDHLFEPNEVFQIGALRLQALHVPGHTPADMAYVLLSDEGVATVAFVGDTLFMPDLGTARCDFPGGSAHKLYHSVRRLLSLPDSTELRLCHDYPPDGRAPCGLTTVGEQRAHNVHMHDGVSEAEFVARRSARDATLDMPTLMLPSIQVNLQAGQLPAAEGNGVRYLRIPLNVF